MDPQNILYEPVTIKVMKDGPLVVTGTFTIILVNNEQAPQRKFVSLCRCGESNNMPYCDGYHRKAGFTSED